MSHYGVTPIHAMEKDLQMKRYTDKEVKRLMYRCFGNQINNKKDEQLNEYQYISWHVDGVIVFRTWQVLNTYDGGVGLKQELKHNIIAQKLGRLTRTMIIIFMFLSEPFISVQDDNGYLQLSVSLQLD